MRKNALFLPILLLTGLPFGLRAQSATNAAPEPIQSGFAVDRLARIDQFLQRYAASDIWAVGTAGLLHGQPAG